MERFDNLLVHRQRRICRLSGHLRSQLLKALVTNASLATSMSLIERPNA